MIICTKKYKTSQHKKVLLALTRHTIKSIKLKRLFNIFYHRKEVETQKLILEYLHNQSKRTKKIMSEAEKSAYMKGLTGPRKAFDELK
jgi:hypothetical protein